jgi:S1-C subfamily serine protease
VRKPALYSRSDRPRTPLAAFAGAAADKVDGSKGADDAALERTVSAGNLLALRRFAGSPRALWLAWGLLTVALIVSVAVTQRLAPRPITQQDIDAAVLRTLSIQALPSAAARAAEKIRPAVVRVTSVAKNRQGEEVETGVGTGVVIVDKGLILTNLHVVQSAPIVRLVFADGSESGATVRSVQIEHDLAVLQATTVPDDLQAATLRSSHDLKAGDAVVAVGFPFGIGPSVSAGVISGLGREFKSPEGEQALLNLIQFDAAANPGNSGGPLITMDGEVVGIVTGILNPSSHRTFVGIGFAVPIESAAAAAGMPPF